MRFPRRPKFKYRPRPRTLNKNKVALVTAVRVDGLVKCPNCGNPMKLSVLWTFKCKRCAQEITPEEALSILDMAVT